MHIIFFNDTGTEEAEERLTLEIFASFVSVSQGSIYLAFVCNIMSFGTFLFECINRACARLLHPLFLVPASAPRLV